MSPTARTREFEVFVDDVQIVRTAKLEASELQVLYGDDEGEYTCSPDEIDHQTEEDEDYATPRSLSSLEDGRLCKPATGQVVFSNETYYSKLEELRRVHLKNIADLERLYRSQLSCCQRDAGLDTLMEETESEQVPPGRHQLLDSDQSDISADEHVMDQWEERRRNVRFHQQVHPVPPPELGSQVKPRPFCPAPTFRGQRLGNSMATVPRPFRMTLREEARKQRRVKSRSEVELENERLRKQLDELKECGRKFRARPVPASTHNPPKNPAGVVVGVGTSSQRPFSFLERERKKKERKLDAALNEAVTTSQEERRRRVFRARPVPKSLYRRRSPEFWVYGAVELQGKQRERVTPSRGAEEWEEKEESQIPEAINGSGRGRGEKRWHVEKEVERRKNGERERERDWSYIHPLRIHSQELMVGCKADYISV